MFDIPSDLAEKLLTEWTGRSEETLEVPTELPELLQKDRPVQRNSFGGGGAGWRRQSGGRSWNGQPREFNRNGMMKRHSSWNAGATRNSRKTFD